MNNLLVPIIENSRLSISVAPRPGHGERQFDVQVSVEPQNFGGTYTETYLEDDLERFANDLDAGPIEGTYRLGGNRSTLVELTTELSNSIGPDLVLECSITRSDDDPQERLSFLVWSIQPFSTQAALQLRSVLSTTPRPKPN